MNSIIYYLLFLLKVSFTASQNSSYQPSSFFYPVLYEEPSSPSFYYTNRSLDTVITIINACFNDFFMQNRTIKGSDYQIKIFEENSNEYNNDLISATSAFAFCVEYGVASMQFKSVITNCNFLLKEELSILYGMIYLPALNANATSFAVYIELLESEDEINKVIVEFSIASTISAINSLPI